MLGVSHLGGNSDHRDKVRKERGDIPLVVRRRPELGYHVRIAEFVPITNSSAARTARSVSDGVGEGSLSTLLKVAQSWPITCTRGGRLLLGPGSRRRSAR